MTATAFSIKALLAAALLAWSLGARAQPAPPSPATNAAAFDQLFEKLNGPDYLNASGAAIEAAIARLHDLLPPNDKARDLRYRSVYCGSLDWKDLAQGLKYSDDAVKLARAQHDRASEARALTCRSTYLMLSKGSQLGLPDLNAAIELLRGHDHHQLLGEVLEMRGDLFSLIGEQAKAMMDFQRARAAYQMADIPGDVEPLMFSIAVAYRRMGESARAERYFSSAAKRLKGKGDNEDYISNLLQLGFLYIETDQAAKALDSFSVVEKSAREHNDSIGINSALLGRAESQILLGHADAALKTLAQAHAGLEHDNDASSNDMLYLLRGRALAESGNHALALAAYQKALPLIQANGNQRYLAVLFKAESASYEALGRSDDALRDYKHFQALQQQLQDKMRVEQSVMLEYEDEIRRRDFENHQLRAQTQAKQQEVSALEAVRRWQRLAIVLGALLIALIGSMAWRQWRRSRTLQNLTLLDPLTGVANRPGIEREAARALAAAMTGGKPVSLLMLDLDRFKSINDRHGHAAGDRVLRAATEAWQTQLRGRDPIGRVGGEEFVVVCLDTTLEKAIGVANRLREATNALRFDDIAPDLRISVSIGAAQAQPPDDTYQTLVDRSDAALYRAKHGGGDRVEY